jgi:hypothetical protein
VTDAAQDGRPPRELYRRGGFAFRKREDGAANPAGGPGVEFSPVGTDGAPTGAWTPFTSARSLPNQRAPLSRLAHGSTQHQLLEMARELARALGRVEDQSRPCSSPRRRPRGVDGPAGLLICAGGGRHKP